jgi:membrane associated rhomboid family serine protease
MNAHFPGQSGAAGQVKVNKGFRLQSRIVSAKFRSTEPFGFTAANFSGWAGGSPGHSSESLNGFLFVRYTHHEFRIRFMNAPADPSNTGEPPPRAYPPAGNPPVFNVHGAIVALAAICIGVHVIRTQFLSPGADMRLVIETAFFPIRYMPDLFRLDFATILSPVTYAFLHGDWVHLTINMVWLAAFGSPLAYRIGWRRSLVFWVVTAAIAAATHLVIYFGDPVPVIGASGAVSGFMGAAARFGLRANRRNPRRGFDGPLLSVRDTFRARGVVPFLLVWIGMNIAIGLDLLGVQQGSTTAWEAHIGGLLSGFFLIPYFDRRGPVSADLR